MGKIKLKVGRNIFEIDDKDLILDNGACRIIITQKYQKGLELRNPYMSKKLFTDLKKHDLIRISKVELLGKSGKYKSTYYKFNIEKMKEMGY